MERESKKIMGRGAKKKGGGGEQKKQQVIVWTMKIILKWLTLEFATMLGIKVPEIGGLH